MAKAMIFGMPCRTGTESARKSTLHRTLLLLSLLVVMDTGLTQDICNTKDKGQFKCECMEIKDGFVSVDCSNNDFRGIPAEQGFPAETKLLNFKNNQIQRLNTNDFLTSPHLAELFLDHNEIETIAPNTFRGLTDLVNISLKNNYLTRIEALTFCNLVNIEHIDLRQNEIQTISSDAFYFMPHLQQVNLQGARLQCDCETRELRSWSRDAGVSLFGAKCSNFIKNRTLEGVPDDQFGECSGYASPQTCRTCSHASSLTECVQSRPVLCMSSCQMTFDITSGQQTVSSQCQTVSGCITSIRNNSVSCHNGHPYQHCTLCCTGRDCNNDNGVTDLFQGYTYQTSMVISFILSQTFDEILRDPASTEAKELTANTLHVLYSVLGSMGDMDLPVEHFRCRPSSDNMTMVTAYSTSIWNITNSAPYIRERIFGMLDNAFREEDQKLDVKNRSLTVYMLGFCMAEITSIEQGEFDWPKTTYGAEAVIDCPYPNQANGLAKRACVSVWDDQDQMLRVKWDDPDLTECTTPSNVTDELKHLVSIPIDNDTVSSIVEDLREFTSSGHMTTTDLEYASRTLEGVLSADIKIRDKTARDVVETYDNLLGVDIDLLQRSQQGFNSIERTLLALDKFSGVLLDVPDSPIIGRRIAIAVTLQNYANTSGTSVFHVVSSEQEEFAPEQVTLSVDSSPTDAISSGSGILVPAPVLNNMRSHGTSAQFVAFSDDRFFRSMSAPSDPPVSMATNTQTITGMSDDTSGTSRVNSVIMAVSFGGLHVQKLTDPIVITFAHKKFGSDARCVFWDFGASASNSDWSSRGCNVTKDTANQYTVCQCDHVTNFALIMDIYGDGANISEGHQMALSIISYIGCAISLAALLLTLLTYSIFSKLHKDNPSKLLMNLCVALSLVMILFIVVTSPSVSQNDMACKATAGLLHYVLLSTWMWMAVEAFYMYLALIKIFKTYISRFILKSCLVGWGVPAVIVILTVAIDTDHYGAQGNICWLSMTPFYWSCLAPIVAIMIVNFVVFSMVIHQLRRLNARNDKRAVKHYGLKTQLRGAVAVVILLGLTWVFAIFAVGKATVAFQYLFCIFNSFQGLFIFIFYCVMKKEVKEVWRKKWTEVTSTKTTSDLGYGPGSAERFLSSRTGSVPNTTLATDSPRITTVRRTTYDSQCAGSRDNLNTSKTNPTDSSQHQESET